MSSAGKSLLILPAPNPERNLRLVLFREFAIHTGYFGQNVVDKGRSDHTSKPAQINVAHGDDYA